MNDIIILSRDQTLMNIYSYDQGLSTSKNIGIMWLCRPENGSTPLHYAARSGSLDCVEELLAWGADRTYKDMMG